MNSYYVIWGAFVVLAGSIVWSAGVVGSAISTNSYFGGGSLWLGSILMLIGLIGPGLGGFLKRAYDSVPVDDKPK